MFESLFPYDASGQPPSPGQPSAPSTPRAPAQPQPSPQPPRVSGPPGTQTLSLEDLPAIDATEAAQVNADLACMARHIFDIAGARVRFAGQPLNAPGDGSGGEPGAPDGEPAAWLWLEWAGVPLLAGFSAPWAGALCQTLGVSLDQLSDEALDLLAQWQLSALLPRGLVLRQAALNRSALGDVPEGLLPMRQWCGLHEATAEPSGHSVQVWAGPGLALQALLEALVPLAAATMPAPLAHLPITLPLVAARWSVDASELQDLAVGDVLLLN